MSAMIDTIKALVAEANEKFVLPRFRNPETQDVSQKSYAYDVVTLADTQAEAFLIETLSLAFPGAYVVGEETISKDSSALAGIFESPLCLLLDPVDGTLNFSQGSAMFGTIVSVLSHGQPIAGLIYDPVVRDWVVAERGSGCWYHRGATSNRLFKQPVRVPSFTNNVNEDCVKSKILQDALGEDFGLFRHFWTSAHEYRFMAFGSCTGVFSNHCKPWDHAAGSVILQEAGGHVEFLDGQPYSVARDIGPLIAVQDKDRFDDLRSRLRPLLHHF